MTVVEYHPRRRSATAASDVLGVPGVQGRWQPVRAGAVNSWAWADETLLFADGWLALAGPNGSGKSLTASMLVTLLLDADTSQKALSVSGEAVGTLGDRHTDRNPREDRTGAWWLEYGRRNPDTGDVDYVTTGVWLRAVGGTLHRAFFMTPTQVGVGLRLQNDRSPVAIDALAAQLAATGGMVFTSSPKLRPKAAEHLPVADEDAYRPAIRTKLFAPLDEVQFDALVGVLRSLRSVRTAEAISPNQMSQVLTDALPALDQNRLAIVAEAMERISDLETQLKRTRDEIRLLERTEDLYGRYVAAVTAAEAAILAHADTRFDDQTRKARRAEQDLAEANKQVEQVNRRRQHLRGEMAETQGRLAAVEAELREHAGAELPHLERRLGDLRAQADRETERAGQAQDAAVDAAERAEASVQVGRDSQRHVAGLGDELQAAGTRIGADAVLERLVRTTADLASARPDGSGGEIAVDADALAGTPLGWTEMRAGQVQQVDSALRHHTLAQQEQRSAAGELRRAEQERDRLDQQARDTATARGDAESALLGDLDRWDMQRVELAAVPAHLAGESLDRLDPDLLIGWLYGAMEAARLRIGVATHQQAVATANARAAAATQTVRRAAEERADADATLGAAQRAQVDTQVRAAEERAGLDEARTKATADHDAAVAAAHRETQDAEADLDTGVTDATQAARAWARQVEQWRASLVHLDAGAVILPDDVDAIDPHSARMAVERAHSNAAAALQAKIAAADQRITAAGTARDEIAAKLAQAQRAAPLPAAPPWRNPRDGSAGMPLWALVDFAPHVTAPAADRLEGALLMAGLLDALVTRDGLVAAGDVTVTADTAAGGRTLADLLVVEPDVDFDRGRVAAILRAIPVDGPTSDVAAGRLQTGVVTAAAPEGYRAAFIGRTARERARLRRVDELQDQLRDAQAALDQATHQREILHAALAAAAAERDTFPAAEAVHQARTQVAQLRLALAAAQRQTAEQLAAAALTLQRAVADIAAQEAAIQVRVADAVRQSEIAAAAAAKAKAAHEAAELALAQVQDEVEDAVSRRDQAEAAQQRCENERNQFPDLQPLRDRIRDEDLAEHDLAGARAAVAAATERHQGISQQVREALRSLNAAATLPDGAMLPTAADALTVFGTAITNLGRQVEAWQHAAARTVHLLRQASTDSVAAARANGEAHRAKELAERARHTADQLQAQVRQARELYGAEYEQLRSLRETLDQQRNQQNDEDERLVDARVEAGKAAQQATTTLADLAPHREEAEQQRDACFRRMSQLVPHGFATVPNDISTDAAGRPANITAAITWARRILADRPAGSRVETLTANRSRALTTLENSARTANAALAKFDQQLDITTLEGTDWRRVALAAPNAAIGEDLRQAVAALRATSARLEADLRDDVKATLKTSMFTQLRRDIQERREMAQELVRQIRTTLAGVRTGVAHVGVEVDWVIREDGDARRMVDLLAAPPSDDVFEQMYQVLRQRMEQADSEAWADRVAHTFDYRSWHEWKISVTHRSFSTDGVEKFRPVTARSNPLKSLSTGESRLATMLPLLAAAWSMYSGDGYVGPRLLSIDEIDAAFDEPNLRQILALLRSWNFDVLATTPTMSPLIKREAQQVVVHQVVTSGRHRVTVPWLWQGSGEPQPLTLDLRTPNSRAVSDDG